MKKNISIVISLFLLFLIFTSCEQEDQINSFKSVESEITIDKNAQIPLEPTTLTKDEITENSCGEPVGHDLYAGQHIMAGTVFISRDEENLYVTYDLSGTEWWLKETHLYVGEYEDVPQGNSGNPKIGNFPYHGDHDMTQEYSFTLPIDDEGLEGCFIIIAHAALVSKENGTITSSETAFAFGEDKYGEPNEFTGNRWGWYLDYCLEPCEDQGEEGNEGEEGEDEEEDSLSENEDDGNGETGLICEDTYAFYDSNASCFTSEGNGWGWSNKIDYDDAYYILPGGVTYILPLYESNEACDISTGIPIGHVEVTVQAGDGEALASIKYVLDIEEWSIQDIQLYVGSVSLLSESNNLETLTFENFNYVLEDFEDNYIEGVLWPFDAYLIAYAKICPPETNP